MLTIYLHVTELSQKVLPRLISQSQHGSTLVGLRAGIYVAAIRM